jgi:hypothetical protein
MDLLDGRERHTDAGRRPSMSPAFNLLATGREEHDQDGV